MSTHSPEYWKAHKQAYTLLFDQLDSQTQQKIMADPSCPEATQLAKNVNDALAAFVVPKKTS